MEWEHDITGLLLADVVTTVGDVALVNRQVSSNIVALAPFIPKVADAADPGYFLASYTLISILGWCLFHQDDTVAMNDLPICDYILSPPAIEAALGLLKDNEVPVQEYASSLGEFTEQVLDFKTKHSVQGLALRASSLQQLQPCTGKKLPSSQAHKFAEKLKIRNLLSYAPVSLFELTAAPRILLASRFAAASSGNHENGENCGRFTSQS